MTGATEPTTALAFHEAMRVADKPSAFDFASWVAAAESIGAEHARTKITATRGRCLRALDALRAANGGMLPR